MSSQRPAARRQQQSQQQQRRMMRPQQQQQQLQSAAEGNDDARQASSRSHDDESASLTQASDDNAPSMNNTGQRISSHRQRPCGVRPPSLLCQPPTDIFPFCWGSTVTPSFFTVVHCSCLAFRTDSAVFVFRTLVKFTSSLLSLSRVLQCIMINYN